MKHSKEVPQICSNLVQISQQISRFQLKFCAKQEIKIGVLSKNLGSAQMIPTKQQQPLQMIVTKTGKQSDGKSFEIISSIFESTATIVCTHNFSASIVSNEKLYIKAIQRPALAGLASIFQLHIFCIAIYLWKSSTVNFNLSSLNSIFDNKQSEKLKENQASTE